MATASIKKTERVVKDITKQTMIESGALGEQSEKDDKEIELESAVFGHDGGIFSEEGDSEQLTKNHKVCDSVLYCCLM